MGVFLALVVPSTALGATTVTVTTTTDVVQAGDGACSLREATLYANGTAEPDCAAAPATGTTTIVVPAGLYRLRGQALTLSGSAALTGAGAATTTIDAAGESQVFRIGIDANVTISDVTISGGVSGQTCASGCSVNDPVLGNPGGGMTNDGGTLALVRVIVTNNRTGPGATNMNCTPQIQSPCPGGDGGDGGGISNFGTTTITDSMITANSTGVGASGKPGAQSSVFFGGQAGTSGSGGTGGGIVNFAFSTLTIVDSTIAGNTTGPGAAGANGGLGVGVNGGTASGGGDGGSGGGIENHGQLVVSGSTISGNETGFGATGGTGGSSMPNGGAIGVGANGAPGGVGGAGGGIASDGDLTISNSTIADNSIGLSAASGDGGTPGGVKPSQVGGANGGGIEELRMGGSLTHVTIVSNRTPGFGGGVDGDGGTITVGNSIIAANQAEFDKNCDGVVTDQGGNVEFGDASCPSGFLRADPNLSPLGNHGGPTQTVAPQPGSAAIHHVRTCVLGDDQRGVARPVGSACDSGAYQVAPPLVVGVSVSAITNTTAGIAANVNPNLRAATVVVNYGRTPSYGSSTPPLDIGAGNDPAPFSAGLGGLVPGATYHFDVVATNADGQTTTSDGTFTTAPPLAASIAGTSTVGPTLSVTITCAGGSGPGACTGPIALTARPSGKHRHSVTVAAGSYSVPAGQQVTVKLGLNRTGRTMLTRQYVLATTMSVRGTTPVTRNVTFRYPRITSKTPYVFEFGPRSSTATQLIVVHVPRGGSVTVMCHGGACPFSVRRFVPRHGQVVLTPFFRNRQFRPGTAIQLRVAAPNRVAEVETLVIRSGQQPAVIHQCLPPGAARPARCAKNGRH
ncbi:MAG TPA: choice-of-anchor Q domain-containing protein [Solirubrobacteraceae bacterium]|nr:choice-of-anchor Q domain-containing protein [Solirubrobacteraceae bacterium]